MSIFDSLIGASSLSGGGFNTSSALSLLGISADGVTKTSSTSGGVNTTHVQNSNVDAELGAFKWLEKETTPEDFASSDSTLLFIGDPIYVNNASTATYKPIGMCQGFTYSSGVNIVPIHELRCEEILVLPGKTQPGQIAIQRFCGDYASLVSTVHGNTETTWNFSGQTEEFRKLFGLLVIFYSPKRTKKLASLYFERCAVNSVSLGVQAGAYQIIESIGITCGRCINPSDKSSYYVNSSTEINPITNITSDTNMSVASAALKASGI